VLAQFALVGCSATPRGRRSTKDHTDVSTTRFTTATVLFVVPSIPEFDRIERLQNLPLSAPLDKFGQGLCDSFHPWCGASLPDGHAPSTHHQWLDWSPCDPLCVTATQMGTPVPHGCQTVPETANLYTSVPLPGPSFATRGVLLLALTPSHLRFTAYRFAVISHFLRQQSCFLRVSPNE
jgi:hypothetical protein